jgi:maltose-6'-phosphate glucosidase
VSATFRSSISDAYFEHSYQKAIEALTLNRLVNDTKKAHEILDVLIQENKDYWPELK